VVSRGERQIPIQEDALTAEQREGPIWMENERVLWRTRVAVMGAGLISTVGLMVLLRVVGLMPPPEQDSYFLSRHASDNVGGLLLLLYFLASGVLGIVLKRPVEIAIGMMAPLPLAFLVEVLLDSTSHNLFPFEILLYWLPAFGLAFMGSLIGSRVRQFWEQSRSTS
jgi:hypothetical protein